MPEHNNGSQPARPDASRVDVWTELLESTLKNRDRSLTSSEWSRLGEVARQYAGGDAFENFVVELVETLLRMRFPAFAQTKSDVCAMSRRIGQTLCSDPSSRQRLAEFHRQLCGNDCGI